MTGAVLALVIMVVPVALVLGAAFGLPRLIEGRRQKAYASFCLSRGYQYVPQRNDATAPYADIVDMFKSGSSHSWRDEICGELNFRSFTAFEYQYVTGAGRSRMVFNRAMIHWRLDGASLPRFSLVPASTFLFRVGRDPNDIGFPEDTAFANAYVLRGGDQPAIRALFTPALRAALVAMPGQFVAAQAADVFWWRERRLPPPDQFDAFLGEGARVVAFLAGS